jgi:hypothetical protein
MRKFFIAILILSLALPLASAVAREAEYSSIEEEQQANVQSDSQLSTNNTNTSGSMSFKIFTGGSLETYLDRAQGYLFAFALVAAVIMIIWAGIDFITSAGDPKKLIVAKSKITNALIGVVVIILAKSIILILQDILKP